MGIQRRLHAAAAVLLLVFAPSSAEPQPMVRRATTLGALLEHPLFFHGKQVAVLAELGEDAPALRLRDPDGLRTLAALARGVRTGAGLVEVRGEFWDVGRLSPDDPRLAGSELRALIEARLGDRWPAQNELPLLQVTGVVPAEPDTGTTRAVALQPERYAGQTVTIVGRFRGRNLYGDLPQAPGVDRWEFVLQAADAALWVVGIRPRGRGFNLDPGRRADTGTWLEVTGRVQESRGLVLVDASAVRTAEPPETLEEPLALPEPQLGPPPDVVFSSPVPDETDVSPDTSVRIQFSRDMDAESFEGRIRVTYVAAVTPVDLTADPSPPQFTWRYRAGPRVVEIAFAEPLARFRLVQVDLLDGLAAFDGATMGPWTLRFTTGTIQ